MAFQLPREAIESLAGQMSEAQASLLAAYGEAIEASGRRMSLVSRAALASLRDHFIDSAALLSAVDIAEGELADLGSGAGLPGAVVAVLRPHVRVSLIDSRRSRIVFLKRVERELGLPNIEVVHARLKELAARGRRFELGVSRALGNVEATLEDSLRLIRPGGRLVLFKGPKWIDEEQRARRIASELGFVVTRTADVDLPEVGRSTTFVEFGRTGTGG